MKVEIWFFANSYRKGGPPYGTNYRPHLIIKGTKEYLGIQFENLRKAPYGEHIVCEIKCSYENVDYSGLIPGARFVIKEGQHAVGEGIVIL